MLSRRPVSVSAYFGVVAALLVGEAEAAALRTVQGTVRDEEGKPVAGVLIYESRPLGDRTPPRGTQTSETGRYRLEVELPTNLGFSHHEFEVELVVVDASSREAKSTTVDTKLKRFADARMALSIISLPVGLESDTALRRWLGGMNVADDGLLYRRTISELYGRLEQLRPYLLHFINKAPETPAVGPYSPAKLHAMQLLVYHANPEDGALARRWWSAVGRDAPDRPPQLDGLAPEIPTRPNPYEAIDALRNVLNLRFRPEPHSYQQFDAQRLLLEGVWYGPLSSPSPFSSRPRRTWDVVLRRTADGWETALYLHRKDDTTSVPFCIR